MDIPEEYQLKMLKMSRIDFYDLWMECHQDKYHPDDVDNDWEDQDPVVKKRCINDYKVRTDMRNMMFYYMYDKLYINPPKTLS